MNWDQIEGKWKQLKGAGRERWGKLTDDDWEKVAGKREAYLSRDPEGWRYETGITGHERVLSETLFASASEAALGLESWLDRRTKQRQGNANGGILTAL
jgi:hypothetical protein